MIAYHGKQEEKVAILAQLQAHADADELVKGQYWEGGKGCAVGCTLHSGNHAEYEPRFGIPQMLARLEDAIFEGLPNEAAKSWPLRFMVAIQPGADLSRVGWEFLHWLLTDEKVNPGINHPTVRDAVKRCADVIVPLTKGEPTDTCAARSAASAASAAECAAWSAAECAARSATWSAESAARSAASAESAAECAARSAAECAAWSAASAECAVWSAESAWIRMADKLEALLRDASRSQP